LRVRPCFRSSFEAGERRREGRERGWAARAGALAAITAKPGYFFFFLAAAFLAAGAFLVAFFAVAFFFIAILCLLLVRELLVEEYHSP